MVAMGACVALVIVFGDSDIVRIYLDLDYRIVLGMEGQVARR